MNMEQEQHTPPRFEFGDVLGSGFMMWLKNFVPFTAFAVVVFIPFIVLWFAVRGKTIPVQPSTDDLLSIWGWALGKPLLLVFLLAILQATVIHAVIQQLKGEQAALGDSFSVGTRRLLPVIAIAFLVVLGLLFVVLVFVVGIYNGLVRLRNEVKNAWSQIDVQLKRRYDLIPNLVETVKGYMQHERETLEAVTKARQQAINVSDSVIDRAKAENMLSRTLRSLFAVAESYPDLKANQNFLALQEELTSTENKVSFARQAFNDAVMVYNNARESFPGNLVAGWFSFKAAELLEIESEEKREVPQVSFQ